MWRFAGIRRMDTAFYRRRSRLEPRPLSLRMRNRFHRTIAALLSRLRIRDRHLIYWPLSFLVGLPKNYSVWVLPERTVKLAPLTLLKLSSGNLAGRPVSWARSIIISVTTFGI